MHVRVQNKFFKNLNKEIRVVKTPKMNRRNSLYYKCSFEVVGEIINIETKNESADM